MNTIKSYPQHQWPMATKRYVQCLTLDDDPSMIAEYCHRHSEEYIWPEIPQGIREVGILEMEIYRSDRQVVMIVETAADFDWDTAMSRLARLPRQQEWEDHMALLQQCAEGLSSTEKWHPMEQIFHLY